MRKSPENRQVLLYLNHSWGSVRTESRSFPVEQGAIRVGTDEHADFPLFGFQLPTENVLLAEWTGGVARVFPPPAVEIERSQKGSSFQPVAPEMLEADGERRFITAPVGTSLRFRERDQQLVVTVDVQRERAGWDKQRAAFWLAFLVIATLGGPAAFLLAGPDPGFVTRALEQARVKQGLPAKHTPVEIAPVPNEDPEKKTKGFVLKVTTSGER